MNTSVHTTTRIASIFLVLIFLSNDVLASAKWIAAPPILKTKKVELTTTAPTLRLTDPKRDTVAKRAKAHSATEENNEVATVSSISQIAYLGGHKNDQLGQPSDDVFLFDLKQDLSTYPFVTVSYKVKGVENGLMLPKLINGRVFGNSEEFIPLDNWQEVSVQISSQEFVSGINRIAFALPKKSLLKVEVKEVSIEPALEDTGIPILKAQKQTAANMSFFSYQSKKTINGKGYALASHEMPSVPRSIDNVTLGAEGYSLERKEKENVKIKISVDPQKIGGAGKLKEVSVFCFDYSAKNWRNVVPDNVDMATMILEATVPGNSEYFTGMIKSPEMPEASAYMPTAMSGLEAANPAAGMNLMSPPNISHTGEAGISYPLDIPQGRNGMTPSLGLSYNSDGGTGWLGLGWSISTPMVSIDTRWGAPTFDATTETEVYSLNGSSLVMEGGKKANRKKEIGGVPQDNNRLSDAYFFENTMSAYKTIQRKGCSPMDYFWIETMANQTKLYYGTTDSLILNDAYVLKNGNNILKWYLSKMVDKWGNTIDYYYSKTTNTTNNELQNGGITVTLDSIRYTGHGTDIGKYGVVFNTSHGREDATVSLKGGIKELDDAILNSISVEYDSREIKRFEFTYGPGDFFKQLLEKVEEYRNNQPQPFYAHSFDYYDGGLTYSAPELIEVDHYDNTFYSFIPEEMSVLSGPLAQLALGSPLKTTNTAGWSIGGSFGVGLAPTPLALLQNKSFTLSGSMSLSQNYSRDNISLTDVNGDGLPDVVYDKNFRGQSFYPMQQSEAGQLSLAPLKDIHFGGRFMKSRSTTFSTGINFAMPANTFFTGTNISYTRSSVSSYLTDFNADGITDVVVRKDGNSNAVNFGKINEKGELYFDVSSEHTYSKVYKDKTITNPSEDHVTLDFEVVRTWEAPFDGAVNITGDASALSGLQGVMQIAIQKNSAFVSGFQTVSSGNVVQTNVQNLQVNKGDLLLFRVHSELDGQEDLLIWNPNVEYTSGYLPEINGLDYNNSNYEDGFLLSTGSASVVSGEEGFIISSQDLVTGALTDTVVLRIKANSFSEEGNHLKEEVWEKTIPPGSNGNGLDFINPTNQSVPGFFSTYDVIRDLEVSENCYLTFEVFSLSNIDWRKVKWRPEVRMDDPCNNVQRIDYPIVKYHTFNRLERLQFPNEMGNYPPLEDGERFQLNPVFNFSPSDFTKIYDPVRFANPANDFIMAYLVLKNQSESIYALALKFNNDQTISLSRVRSNGELLSGNVQSHFFRGADMHGSQEMYVEFFAETQGVANFISQHLEELRLVYLDQEMEIPLENWNLFCKDNDELQDQMLHWGQFGWNGAGNLGVIDTSDLYLATKEFAKQNTSEEPNTAAMTQLIQNNQALLDPANQQFFTLIAKRGEHEHSLRDYIKAYPMQVSPTADQNEALDRWSVMGSYIAAYAKGGIVAPGKFGEPEDELVGNSLTLDDYSAYGVKQISKSTSSGQSVGSGPYTFSATVNTPLIFNTQAKSAFQDVNGDGYPDVLTYNSTMDVNFTQPTGGHKSAETMYAKEFNKSTSNSAGMVASGRSITEDKRFLNASLSGNFGLNYSNTEFVDINGDGLPERLVSSSSGIQANLNDGKDLDGATTALTIQNNKRTQSTNESFSVGTPVYTNGTNPTYSILEDGNVKSSGSHSYSGGVNINKVGSRSVALFRDVNGDGLADWIEFPLSGKGTATVFINKGTSFDEYTDETVTYPEGTNKAEAYGFSANVNGTYSLPSTPIGLASLKFSINGNLTGNFSVNKVQSMLIDMNGDGVVDYVESDVNGDLQVRYAQVGKSNKLKTVTNPLKGSFTIDYELIGNKFGAYPVKVETHLTKQNDKIIWDMPNSKWVMSSLKVFDGLDVMNGAADADGVDTAKVFFAYDGGLKSRREREFLGFTRIEKRHLFNEDDVELVNESECVDVLDDSYTYLTEVTEYSQAKSNNPSYFKRFDYLKNVVENKLTLYNKIDVFQSVDLGNTNCGDNPFGDKYVYSFTKTIKPISIQSMDYEFRHVSITDRKDSDFNKIANTNGVWENVNWNTITELNSIFPALVSTSTYTFPQVEDATVDDKYYTMSYNIEYDEYFNVTNYRNEGTMTEPDIDTVVVDTLIHTHYIYKYKNHDPTTGLSGYLNANLSGPVFDVFVIPYTDASYSTDTLVLPTQTSGNFCFDSMFSEGDTVTSTHRKLVHDTTYITEFVDNSIYNGAVIAEMEYYTPNSAAKQTGLLRRHKVFVGSTHADSLKRHTYVHSLENGYAPSVIRNYLNATDYAETSIDYNNTFGTVIEVESPVNHNSQRLLTEYTYDNVLHQFVVLVSNSYGDAIVCSYDYATGNLKRTVDINGHPTQYVYDNMYRLQEIWAPRELATANSSATIRYAYHPFGTSATDTVPVAITHHNMARNGTPPNFTTGALDTTWQDVSNRPVLNLGLRTATFVDGMGKTVQVKKDAAQNGSQVLMVSGMQAYDHLMRVKEVRANVLETSGNIGVLNTATSPERVSKTDTFDYMSRPVYVSNLSAGTTRNNQHFAYTWEPDGEGDYWYVEEIKQAGDSHNKTYKDSWGRAFMSKALGDNSEELVTTFKYNPLGELLHSINPLLVKTSYTYDNFGRMVQEDHKDRGFTKMGYDMAGNVTKIWNASTGLDKPIEMDYHYNRLKEKTLPSSQNLYGVTYSYGTLNDGSNGAGRIVQVSQGGSFKLDEYKYDELGNLVHEGKSIQLPDGTRSYVTKYGYDSWGRVLEMTYPDNEHVKYLYKTQTGELDAINSKLSGETTYLDIVKTLQYDGYGNMSHIEYGNGATTDFTYNLYSQSLQNVTVNTEVDNNHTTRDILNKTYNYDALSRVTQVSNSPGALTQGPSEVVTGGAYTFGYTYDRYNRLATTTSNHQWQASGAGNTSTYTLAMDYNKVGGITDKTQSASNANTGTNYDFDYSYNTQKKHQLELITNTSVATGQAYQTGFAYNEAGSLRAIAVKPTQSNIVDTTERFVRNEEQLLMGYGKGLEAGGNPEYAQFVYDHTGERVLKRGLTTSQIALNGQETSISVSVDPSTIYVNPYYVVTAFSNNDKTSKHYYMGTQRVATNMGLNMPPIDIGDDPINPTKTTQQTPLQENLLGLLDQLTGEEKVNWENVNLTGVAAYEDYYPEEQTTNKTSSLIYTPRLMYYYHPDYLGNVEYITDSDGKPYQYFWYSPWGENLKEEKPNTNTWSSPYRFNGKELDEETGLYYYGARYYNPSISVWLSVDPMSSERAWLTPYQFVQNNPIMLVDPTGKLDTKFENIETGETVEVKDGINQTVQLVNGCDWESVKSASKNGVMNNPSSNYNNIIVSNGGVAVPTEKDGGLFEDRSMFLGYMRFKAKNEKREVAAFEVKKNKSEDTDFVVQPWSGNTWKESKNDESVVRKYGYYAGDIKGQYHTHPMNTLGGVSVEDVDYHMNLAPFQENRYPVYTISKKGELWRFEGLKPKVNGNPEYHRYGSKVKNQ